MDAITIILIVVALILGYIIGKWLTKKQKFSDKEARLNAEWKEKVANLQKDYEIKLEQGKSLLSKIKEENKTQLEKLTKELKIQHIQDLEELKKIFKESEKKIKQRSVSSSRRTLVGKFIERFIPFLKNIPYAPSDMHFMGNPIDYIVFEGLRDDEIKRVGFIEVKTGESKLTKRELSLKKAIEEKKVFWEERRVDIPQKEETPDKEMAVEDTSINELYENIDNKISSVKKKTERRNVEDKLKGIFEGKK